LKYLKTRRDIYIIMFAPFDLQCFIKNKEELQKIEKMNNIVYSGLFIMFCFAIIILLINLGYTILFTS
jgi:hypothetical protein